MRACVCIWIVCAGVAYAGAARGAPAPGPAPGATADVRAKYQLAVQLDDRGDYDKALVSIDEGLALAPGDLALLGLKGTVLLELRDYAGALTAYQAYLDAGAKGANRREAQKIVNSLRAVQSTFLDVTVENGPAVLYLDSKAQGVFCTAAPGCKKAVLPGDYKVIAERAGFERWTGRVTVETGRTATLAIALVEKPSLLTVRAAPPGAGVTVDGAAFDAPAAVTAGRHQVVVSLAGHAGARLEASAHEGKPVELDVALAPLVPIRVEPPGAALALDGNSVEITGGRIALPPGAHVLVARAGGFRDRRIDIPRERTPDYRLAVELARIGGDAQAASPGAAGEPMSPRKLLGIGMIEGGGAVLGLGFILEVQAQSSSGSGVPAAVLVAAGGAAIVAGVIVWFTAPTPGRRQALHVVPTLGNDRLGFSVAGRF